MQWYKRRKILLTKYPSKYEKQDLLTIQHLPSFSVFYVKAKATPGISPVRPCQGEGGEPAQNTSVKY